MSNSSNGNSGKTSGGIGFFGVLQLILITLKLCKVITWSWWLVLLPIWIGGWTYGNSYCNHRDRNNFEVGGKDIDAGADEKPQHHRRNVWKRCTGGYGY